MDNDHVEGTPAEILGALREDKKDVRRVVETFIAMIRMEVESEIKE